MRTAPEQQLVAVAHQHHDRRRQARIGEQAAVRAMHRQLAVLLHGRRAALAAETVIGLPVEQLRGAPGQREDLRPGKLEDGAQRRWLGAGHFRQFGEVDRVAGLAVQFADIEDVVRITESAGRAERKNRIDQGQQALFGTQDPVTGFAHRAAMTLSRKAASLASGQRATESRHPVLPPFLRSTAAPGAKCLRRRRRYPASAPRRFRRAPSPRLRHRPSPRPPPCAP